MTLDDRVNDVSSLLRTLPSFQDIRSVEGRAGGDHETINQLGVSQRCHHGDSSSGVEAEDGGLVHLELVLEVDEVGGHLLDGGVGALGGVTMVPRVRNDDGPLGDVVDLLAKTGQVLLPPKQGVLNYQWG